MTKFFSKWLRISMVGVLVVVAAITLFVFDPFDGSMLFGRQVSQEEANRVCQNFYDEVRTNIVAVDSYTILGSEKSCDPKEDEAGATDYYFNVVFRVSRAGNETVEGIKVNIEHLAKTYPQTTHPLWVRNDAAVNGRPDTICVAASKQIQETGEVYNPLEPKHYTDYTIPGSLPEYAPCGDAQLSLV